MIAGQPRQKKGLQDYTQWEKMGNVVCFCNPSNGGENKIGGTQLGSIWTKNEFPPLK
jgi:hypothetical protein